MATDTLSASTRDKLRLLIVDYDEALGECRGEGSFEEMLEETEAVLEMAYPVIETVRRLIEEKVL